MSDIRVSVEWQRPTVFAGEDVVCCITFRNTSQPAGPWQSKPASFQSRGPTSSRLRPKTSASPPQTTPLSHTPLGSPSIRDQHFTPFAKKRVPSQAPASTTDTPPSAAIKSANHKHRRSISIVSLGHDNLPTDWPRHGQNTTSTRLGRGHNRTTSLQVLPRRTSHVESGQAYSIHNPVFITHFYTEYLLVPYTDHKAGLASAFFESSTNALNEQSRSQDVRKSEAAQHGAYVGKSNFSKDNLLKYRGIDSEFPLIPPSAEKITAEASNISIEQIDATGKKIRSASPSQVYKHTDRTGYSTKYHPSITKDGMSRTSSENYSPSNISSETIASEYPNPDQAKPEHQSAHTRQLSALRLPRSHPTPEVLLMGYGHITGSFTLDGSLVSLTPFEEVKRKDVVGAQSGGGIVRTESIKRESGLFGSLGWSNIGESLGSLIKSGELSSTKESRGITGTKSVPILSTPQAILFVDLRLGPGETKSFVYRHGLPRGIPPTYRGKAIKVSYNLVIGVQRSARPSEKNQLRHINIPFRVYPGVNGKTSMEICPAAAYIILENGEILGHDLMSPHIMLHNSAVVSMIDKSDTYQSAFDTKSRSDRNKNSSQDFSLYLEQLLSRSLQSPSMGLVSPSDAETQFRLSSGEDFGTANDLIELAVLQRNSPSASRTNPTRFEISRGGDRVGTIILARPAYRLGEMVLAAVDFRNSNIPCYLLHATLETLEIVDPALALRSKMSIDRISRRIYASRFETVMWADRTEFNPTIPSIATPEFVTSGVCLEWRLRFTFTTNVQARDGDSIEIDGGSKGLLEELVEDERGSVMAGTQVMPSENFEVCIPLRVYGSNGELHETTRSEDYTV